MFFARCLASTRKPESARRIACQSVRSFSLVHKSDKDKNCFRPSALTYQPHGPVFLSDRRLKSDMSVFNSSRLVGKTVLLTGASSGIGKVCRFRPLCLIRLIR